MGAVLWLVQNGANVGKVKEDGWKYTALHYAACKGHEEIVKILVAYGAEIGLENFLGETAAQVASNMGHRKVSMYLELILKGGADGTLGGMRLSSLDSTSLPSIGTESGENPRVLNDEQRRQLRDEYSGFFFEREAIAHTELSRWKKKFGRVFRAKDDEFEAYMKRGFEGYGTPGTVPGRYLRGFRRVAEIYLVISFLYLLWRALRSLNPGWWYFYSVPFYVIELTGWTMGLCFIYSLYYQIDRPSRSITRMLPEEEYPKVDIFICRYSEPVEILEATTVAALNIDYPGDKLSVYVLDDGKSDEVLAMCKRLRYQLRYMDRRANLFYVGREKRKGTPHHAKAGNINNTLLMHSSEDTQYILVLDCDMIIHPTFLHRTLSHFYVPNEEGRWRQKDFVGLLQTPQDFWNVDSEDPMVHCARFFYGPMLQGRDGAGACPCCGTGVIFQRSTLVSVGGQSYGSITEDCNTSMQLLSSGFGNMFLNERLVYGMAPEDLAGVFQQRARWAMGAIQILYRDNPLRKRGLTMSQSFLFFEIGAHHYLAIGTAMATLVPLIYVYVEASPVIVEYLWEFCIVFGVFFGANRVMIWWAHRGCASGGTLELWRGGQMWIWMCPSHIKAVLKTFVSETNLFWFLGSFELTFKVTSKDTDAESVDFWESLWFALPFVVYILAVIASSIYFIVVAIVRSYSTWTILMTLTAIAWSVYISLCIWPPVSAMIPRVETEQGWKISWDTAIDESKLMVDEKNRVVRRPKDKKVSRRRSVNDNQKEGMGRQNSLVSMVVKQMEEGASAYDFAGLTKDAINTYRLGVTSQDDLPNDEVSGSFGDEYSAYLSPFVDNHEEQNDHKRSSSGNINLSDASPNSTDLQGPTRSMDGNKGALRARIQKLGSDIIHSVHEGFSAVLPQKPLSQKAASMNIGRVALPGKTARGIAGSMYTSIILPEPGKVRFDEARALSARALSDATMAAYGRSDRDTAATGAREDSFEALGLSGDEDHRDVRGVSFQSLASQDSMRRSLILMDESGPAVARRLVQMHSQMQSKKSQMLSKGPKLPTQGSPAFTDSFLDALSRSVIITDTSDSGNSGTHQHVVLQQATSQTDSAADSMTDMASPFIEEEGVATLGSNDPSFTSPFEGEGAAGVAEQHTPSDSTRTTTTTASACLGPRGQQPALQRFTLTKDGRVKLGGENVGLEALLGQVVTEMKFSAGPMGSLNPTLSPMMDASAGGGFLSEVQPQALSAMTSSADASGTDRMDRMASEKTNGSIKTSLSSFPLGPLASHGSQVFPSAGSLTSAAITQSSVQHQRYGRNLLRSMSMSYRENLTLDSQKVVDLQRRMIPTSIIMGEGATDVLSRRLMNQPGSIVLSTLFTQLSQMQPSVLQKQGLILPIIPDDIFEYTIASKPSFEFRVLPDKTITFFTVNFTILVGVCAGGIVSIFFQGGS